MAHVYACLTLALLALGAGAPCLAAQSTEGTSLVALVRHAEQARGGADDPGLTALGRERARDLARLLGSAGITRILASDYRRARETAKPLAERLGVPIQGYDPRELEALATRLAADPGRVLVVGHSNTTDELAVLLGGRGSDPIAEEWEHDRLYLLTPAPGGGTTTILLRYGPPGNAP